MSKKSRTWLRTLVRRSVVRTSLITSAVGIFLVSFVPLENLSFDLATLLKPATTMTNAVVVYVNKDTLALGAEQGRLNRTNYARLVDHLTDCGAKLVFLDVTFEQPSATPEVDPILARAIRKQGSVILVAGAEDQDEPGSRHVTRLFPPIHTFADAARGWGHAEVFGNIVRQIPGRFAFTSYAGWVAATNLAQPLQGEAENRERWLNYYGSPENTIIPTCSLQNAVLNNVPNGFFANRIVFVGQNFPYGDIGGRKDTFGTPYSRFGLAPSPGVVIHATALLNLICKDWLRRMTLPWQWLSAVAWGVVVVSALYSLSRKPKLALVLGASLSALALCAISLYAQWHLNWCWSWLGPVCGQTPLALVLVMRNPKPDRYVAFISYRRKEDGETALLLARSLADFGLKTFIDQQSLNAGNFEEQLLREIESSTFFIPILSPHALERCANPADWLLRELTHALKHQKKIIPILKDGFALDATESISNLWQIAELAKYHGVPYSNSDFDGFMARLRTLLHKQ